MAFPANPTDGQIHQGYKYNSNTGWEYSPDYVGKSAKDLLERFSNIEGQDGWYWIKPEGYSGSAFQVYCDMTTSGGGWMRLMLKTRQWGNNYGFDTDPISTTYGVRVEGSASNLPFNTTNCGTHSIVNMDWEIEEGLLLTQSQISALNNFVVEGYTDYYSCFDDDINAPQIKGCYNDSVVMLGNKGSATGSGDLVWTTVQMEVNTLAKIFTTGEYVGHAQANGVNMSLPIYWYFR